MNPDPDLVALVTLDEVAEVLGMDRESVRRVERRALHKVRKALLEAGFGLEHGRTKTYGRKSNDDSE
jgi:hypothetical protein